MDRAFDSQEHFCNLFKVWNQVLLPFAQEWGYDFTLNSHYRGDNGGTSGHFYGLDVYASKDQPQRSAKLKYDEANKWLKETLEYIHEGDLIPRRYNSGMEDLDLIVARLEELGIEASHGDYMDVS